MKRLALLLAALLALAIVVTAYGKPKIGHDICHKADSHKWILLEQMPWSAWENGHSQHPEDFLVTDAQPCPPVDEDNYSPAPTPTQVPPGPAPNPVPTDTPENWLEYYMPVIFGNNLY